MIHSSMEVPNNFAFFSLVVAAVGLFSLIGTQARPGKASNAKLPPKLEKHARYDKLWQDASEQYEQAERDKKQIAEAYRNKRCKRPSFLKANLVADGNYANSVPLLRANRRQSHKEKLDQLKETKAVNPFQSGSDIVEEMEATMGCKYRHLATHVHGKGLSRSRFAYTLSSSSTFTVSSLIYDFSQLRKLVRKGGIRNSWWNPFAGRTQLEHAELIMGRGEKAPQGRRSNNVLAKPIPASDIRKVLTNETLRYLSDDMEVASDLNVRAINQLKKWGKDAYLWEFDDQFANSQLVYGITVNR